MKIRLTRKFAEFINGVDLTHRQVGDVIDLPRHDAEILIAENWGLPTEDSLVGTTADDRLRSSTRPAK